MKHRFIQGLLALAVWFVLQSAASAVESDAKKGISFDKIPKADVVIGKDDALSIEQRGGDFTLFGSQGAVKLSDYKGKVVAIYFGYTQCPDVCPTNLALLGSAIKQLTQEELEDFQGIFISVDPGRDPPEQLDQYTSHFHPKIIGISGAPADLNPVVAQYGAFYEKTAYSNSAMLYGIAHTSEIYIIDQEGALSVILPHATMPDKILEAIRITLD